MELDLLRTFLVYCETGNAVETGRRLGISQPAVSGQLQRLEAMLPQPLFLTQGRRKIITPYGLAMQAAIAGPLVAVERAVERVHQRFGRAEELTLRVGCRRELIGRVAPYVRFAGTVIYEPCPTAEVERKLARLEIDIGITHTPPESAELSARRIFREGCAFVAHRSLLKGAGAGRARSWRDFQDPELLRSLPALIYKPDAPFLRAFVEAAGVALTQIQKKTVCEDWPTIMRLAAAGLGYAVVPSSYVQDLENEGQGDLTTAAVPPSICPVMSFYAVSPRALLEIPAYAQVFAALVKDCPG